MCWAYESRRRPRSHRQSRMCVAKSSQPQGMASVLRQSPVLKQRAHPVNQCPKKRYPIERARSAHSGRLENGILSGLYLGSGRVRGGDQYLVTSRRIIPSKEVAMALAPIDDLFSHRLRQAYTRSTPGGTSSTDILRRRYRVTHYVMGVFKWFTPRMKIAHKHRLNSSHLNHMSR